MYIKSIAPLVGGIKGRWLVGNSGSAWIIVMMTFGVKEKDDSVQKFSRLRRVCGYIQPQQLRGCIPMFALKNRVACHHVNPHV